MRWFRRKRIVEIVQHNDFAGGAVTREDLAQMHGVTMMAAKTACKSALEQRLEDHVERLIAEGLVNLKKELGAL